MSLAPTISALAAEEHAVEMVVYSLKIAKCSAIARVQLPALCCLKHSVWLSPC